MTKRHRSSQGMRNLGSGLGSAAKFTGNVVGKSAVGLFRWASTGHLGTSRTLLNLPSLSFIDKVKYSLVYFIISVASAILTGIWIFLLVNYGIPFLITGSFNP